MKYAALFISLFFINTGIIQSQTVPYDNFTTEEGLADNNTFNIIADSTGFLWIGTDNGLVKFDGTTFKTFGIKNGLKSPIITALCLYNSNQLLVECFRQGLQKFDGTKADSFLINEDNTQIYQQITFYKNRYYFIDANNYRHLCYIEDQKITIVSHSIGTNCLSVINNELYAGTDHGLYKVSMEGLNKLTINGIDNYKIYSLEGDRETIWLGGKGQVIKLQNNNVDRIITNPQWKGKMISQLCLDNDHNIWISTFNGGLYYEKNATVIPLLDTNIWISDLFKDAQGFIWVATYGNGIYKFYNSYIANYSYLLTSTHKGITAIDKVNGSIIMAGNNETILINPDKSISTIDTRKILPREFLFIDNTLFIIGQTQEDLVEKIFNTRGYITHFIHGTVVFFHNNTIKVAGYGAITNYVYKNKKLTLKTNLIYDSSFLSRANDIININDTFWLGTTGSTYKIYGNTSEKLNNKLLKNVNDIALDNDSNLWFATINGLVKLAKPYHINSCELIYTGSFNAVTCCNNEIWAASSNGLYIIKNGTLKILTGSQGLPSSNITALYYDEEEKNIWIGTDKGICSINTNTFSNIKFLPPLKILFEEVATEDSIYKTTDQIYLGHKTNYFRVTFSALNFSGMGTANFQYSLDGESWIDTKDKDLYVTLNSLKYGEHKLNIRGMNPNSSWCYADDLLFYIETPVYKSTGFYFTIILAGILLITTFSYYRIKTVKKKQADELELERKINQLQNMSLSAMMNPHFIFNSLSSIQYLVNTTKTELANTYIAKLARLIRMNLTDADEEEIALNRELERVELYLKLEQLRFEDKFDYQINIPDNLKTEEISIPPLVLQPLVENCIKHGIMPSHKKGLITVVLKRKGDLLYIHVTDNGVGLGKAKYTPHQSKGLYIIKERILLRNNNNQDNDFDIRELIDRTGNIIGTEAIVKLKIEPV